MGFVQARERADSRERERERDETWRSWPGWPLLLSVRVRVRQRRYGFSAGKDDQCFSSDRQGASFLELYSAMRPSFDFKFEKLQLKPKVPKPAVR